MPAPGVEPVFDGECCEMFGDTDTETERVYRELWARKPLAWRVEHQRVWYEWVHKYLGDKK